MSAVRIAEKMKDNPTVALTRVPGLMSGLGNISGSLSSIPAFNALAESMPEAITLARATSETASYVQQAQSALNGVDGSNIAAALDTVSGQLNSASTTFTRMSPGVKHYGSQNTGEECLMFLKHVTRDGSAGTRLRGSTTATRWAIPGLLPLIRTWPSRRCFPPGCCYLSRLLRLKRPRQKRIPRHG